MTENNYPRRTLIIAEAGVNHNGDEALAVRLIDAAAQAGADVIKFQTFRAASLVSADAPKAPYQQLATTSGESQYEMLRRLELSPEAHRRLVAHCAARSIEFLSTGFDIPSVDFLLGLGVARIKVPSGEITNLPYLQHVGRSGKPIILSTGMSTLDDVAAALQVLEEVGVSRAQLTILHCTTAYPTPMSEVNLRAMTTLAASFGVRVGYSDHTAGNEVPVAAVALGATVIEKHLTLDRRLPGPDHAASIEPDELRALVSAIRRVETALGSAVKAPTTSERINMVAARKSIVAARTIAAGELLSDDNLTAKRPGDGLSPMRWREVVGRIAHRKYDADEQIEL